MSAKAKAATRNNSTQKNNSKKAEERKMSKFEIVFILLFCIIIFPILLAENPSAQTTMNNANETENSIFPGVNKTPEVKTGTVSVQSSPVEKAVVQGTTKTELSQITPSSSTKDRINATINFLTAEGFTPEAAAGVVGNMAVESSFNPAVVSKAGYHGLFQWNTNAGGNYWWYTICEWLDKNGYSRDSFEGQVKAMLYCPRRGGLSDSKLAELKSLHNVEQAAELFAVYYEGCVGGSDYTTYYLVGTKYQALNLRKSEAVVAYNVYSNPSQEYNGVRTYYA